MILTIFQTNHNYIIYDEAKREIYWKHNIDLNQVGELCSVSYLHRFMDLSTETTLNIIESTSLVPKQAFR